MTVKAYPEFSLLMHGPEDQLKMLDVLRIGEIIPVRVAVEVDELIRSEERLYILQALLRGGEEAHPGILEQGLQPLLFKRGQRGMERVPQGR